MSWVEIIADRKIREAQEEGSFEQLQGAGEPVDLDRDRHIPPEERLGYRLMRDANMLPDWIELDRSVCRSVEEWRVLRDDFTRRCEGTAEAPGAAEAGRFLIESARRLVELNRGIDRLNLMVPLSSRQRGLVHILAELEQLEARAPMVMPSDASAWRRQLPEKRGAVKLDNRVSMRRRARSPL